MKTALQGVFCGIIKNMENFILDANLFFNMQAGLGLGKKTEEVILGLTKKARELKNIKKADFFMPPSVVSEFLSFFEDKGQPLLKNFLSVITIKAPDYGKINFSSVVFGELVGEIRQRSYRGLNIGEEEIEKAGRSLQGKKDLDTKGFQIEIGKNIKTFRERYRTATRIGFLDSVADLDLIVLAKETNGFVVSTDEGVIAWARKFGVKELPAIAFLGRLNDLALPRQE